MAIHEGRAVATEIEQGVFSLFCERVGFTRIDSAGLRQSAIRQECGADFIGPLHP